MKHLVIALVAFCSLFVAVPVAMGTGGTTNIFITCGRASTATASGTYGGVAFSITCNGHTDGFVAITGNTSQVIDATITYPSGSCTWQQDGLGVPPFVAFTKACGPTQTTIYR